MIVKNRYGGVQNLPDRVARYLLAVGTVSAVAPPKRAPQPDLQSEPQPARRGRPPKAE